MTDPTRTAPTTRRCPGPLCHGDFRPLGDFYVKRVKASDGTMLYSSYCRACTIHAASREKIAERVERHERARQAEAERLEQLRAKTKARRREKF